MRAFATDCVDVCAGGCACHLMRHACVTVPLAGAASSEIAPAAGFCVSVLFVECHHGQCSMSSSHRCGWPADGQAEKEQLRSRVTPARPWSPYPRDRGLRAPSEGVSPSFGAPASCNGWQTGGQAGLKQSELGKCPVTKRHPAEDLPFERVPALCLQSHAFEDHRSAKSTRIRASTGCSSQHGACKIGPHAQTNGRWHHQHSLLCSVERFRKDADSSRKN